MTLRRSKANRVYRVLDATKRREDLLRMLKVEGCPLCAVATAEEASFFEWYRIEKNAEAQMVNHLRRSHGFCPRHTRAFGVDGLTNGFLTSMLDDVTRYGLSEPKSARCPACESVHTAVDRELRRLVRGLDDPPVVSAYLASKGLCAPHAWAVLVVAPPAVATHIVTRLQDQLPERPSLGTVAGADGDAEARSRLLVAGHKTLESEVQEFAALHPIERLVTELDIAACPICRAYERGVVAYFRFLGEEVTRPSPSAEVAQLCAAHLHDLAGLDERAGGWALASVATRLSLDLTAYHEVVQWNALPRRSRLRRAWDGAPRHWRMPGKALAQAKRRALLVAGQLRLAGNWECRACAAGETLGRRELALFRAATGELRIEHALGSSFGFCLQHASEVPSASAVLQRRLAIEQWALDEATRKIAWDTRYEPKGSEYETWRTTVAHYDGATYLGLSADEVAQRLAPDADSPERKGA